MLKRTTSLLSSKKILKIIQNIEKQRKENFELKKLINPSSSKQLKKEISKQIIATRKKHNLNQKELSGYLNLSQAKLSKVENCHLELSAIEFIMLLYLKSREEL